MTVRVIGVGSPCGDDAVGWWVAESLRGRRLPGGAEVVTRDRPGLGLLDELEELEAAVLVDAMRSGGWVGSVRVLGQEELGRGRGLSSHGLGVAATVALGEALGRRMPALRLVGIEIRDLARGTPSPRVRRAVPHARAAVLHALRELRRRNRKGGGSASRASRPLSSGTGELL